MRVALLLATTAGCSLVACSILVDTDDLRASADAGTDGAVVSEASVEGGRPDSQAPDAAVGGYAGVVLASGPIGYWRLEESVGPVAKDATGNGNDLAIVGQVKLSEPGALAEPANRGVRLMGGYLSAGDKFSFPGMQSFSLEAWVRPELLDGSPRRIFTKARPAAPRDGYEVWFRDVPGTSTAFETFVADQSAGALYLGSVVQPSAFVHFVAVRDGGTLRLYANGVQVGSAATTASLAVIQDPFIVGAASNGTVPLMGWVDEVAVYDRALPGSEISSHYGAR